MSSNEGSHKGHDRSLEIARSVIDSQDHGRRLSALREKSDIQKKIIEECRQALHHRDGTGFEDLIYINTMTGEVRRQTGYEREREVKPTEPMRRLLEKAEEHTVIAIHNHPGSTVPSPADIRSMVAHKYKYGLVIGHDGSLFRYSSVDGYDPVQYYYAWAHLDKNGYSTETFQVFIAEALLAGIALEVL